MRYIYPHFTLLSLFIHSIIPLDSFISLFLFLSTSYSSDLSKQVEIQQRLDSQYNETTSVEKEFGKLEDGDEVFKLMGPVLVKQEVEEAKINVQKRVEFIKSEMWVRRTR